MKQNQWYDDDKIGKKIKCGSLGSYAAIAAVKDRLGTEPGENMNIQNWADEMMMVMIVMMMVIKTMMMVTCGRSMEWEKKNVSRWIFFEIGWWWCVD